MEKPMLVTDKQSDRVALRGVHISSRLEALCQRTTMTQTYINLENSDIEAVYTFPLPESAAVCGFEIITADRTLAGAVEESDQAIERYEKAVEDGHGAFLMEEDRPDIFTLRIGSLKAHQAVTIRISYVAPLLATDGEIRLAFPTTVAPRYVSHQGRTDPLETIADGDAINPPHVLATPFGLTFDVTVALGRALARITSPSHAIAVQETSETERRIVQEGSAVPLDRDVVLSIKLATESQPVVDVVRREGSADSFLALSFLPDIEPPAQSVPCESVFVLDCSGSMSGDSIAQAKAALELCLRSLSEGDTFNICLFGSTYQLMASEPLVYSQKTLDHALRYVRSAADLGGTELLPPLQDVLQRPPKAGTRRQVILLTDGQVSNESAVIALARKQRGHNRIFTFGIGASASASLVSGLARATGGAAEFITRGERIDEKVLRTFARLSAPAIENVTIDWGNSDVQTLAELPPIYDGDPFVVFARVAGSAPKQIRVSGNTAGSPVAWTLSVPPPRPDNQSPVPTLWARRAIQSLEEVNDITRLTPDQRKTDRDCRALVALSKEFNLLCSLTTFLAIEYRTPRERELNMPAQRRIAVMLPSGWGGTAAGAALPAAAGTVYAAAVMPMAAPLPMGAGPRNGLASPSQSPGKLRSFVRRLAKSAPPSQSVAHDAGDLAGEPAPPANDLSFLLSLQDAKGLFATNPRIKAICEVHNLDFAALHRQSGKSGTAAADTLFVMQLLRKAFAPDRSLWRRAYDKAARAMAKALNTDIAGIERILDELWQAYQHEAKPGS